MSPRHQPDHGRSLAAQPYRTTRVAQQVARKLDAEARRVYRMTPIYAEYLTHLRAGRALAYPAGHVKAFPSWRLLTAAYRQARAAGIPVVCLRPRPTAGHTAAQE